MQSLNGKHLIEFGEFQLDSTKNVLRRNGEMVSLPLKAVELLIVLVENHGEVVSKEELMNRVWADSFVEDSVLTQNIYLLRKTLGTNGSKDLIKTVPRRGYIFEGQIMEPSNGSATVIERHLFERVSLDVEEETKVKTFGALRSISTHHVAASVILLSLIAVATYFYFRNDTRPSAIAGLPPLKLKPFSVASGYKSLAVLPFKGLDEQFASSFSRDLSIRLGSANKFAVKPTELVNEYAKHGAELKTDFVLEGDLQIESNGFGATVRLTDVKNNSEIWSEKFEFDNAIQLQDVIANRTAKEITGRLTSEETAAVSKRLPSNLSAYENYQTGYALWRRRADGSAYLKRTVELDQSFAPAYALLANISATSGTGNSPEAQESEKLLQKAFSLDENLADAYAVQGFIRIFHHRDWPGAESSLKSALELDANNVNALHWLGVYYSLHRRLDEAKAEMHRALELDPTNPTLLADIGQLHYFAGENDIASEFVSRALAIDSAHPFANEYQHLLRANSSLGDPDETLKILGRAADSREFTLPYINVDPKYDSIRNDLRFQQILRRMNL